MSRDSYSNPRNHHIVCACASDEHTLRLMHFKGDPEKADDLDEVYWSVYLNPFPWYKRLWIAMRVTPWAIVLSLAAGIAAR